MKRFLITVICLAFFSSCEERWGGSDDPVVGEWKLVNWTFTRVSNGEVTYEKEMNEDGFTGLKYIFQEDGSGVNMSNFRMDGKDNWQTVGSFNWFLADGNLAFSDRQFINPPGMIIDVSSYYSESDWEILNLTDREFKVSYSTTLNSPEDVEAGMPDETEHGTMSFRKVRDY
jgi:hypothetical protein